MIFALKSIRRGGSVAICCVAAMHFYQAIVMLADPLAGGATPLLAMEAGFRAAHAPDGLAFMCATMVVTVALALSGTFLSLGWARLAFFIPQHILLAFQAGGGIWATVLGRYLDGTVIPRSHISVDQIFVVALFVIHFSAILRRSAEPG